MTNPIISVVIPHLNQREHLASCLESLARQSYDLSRVEIIVVDNGSQESPVDVCIGVEGVRLVQEFRPGPGPARNRGVKASSGEILAFIDADCALDPAWLGVIGIALTGDSGANIIGGDVRILRRDPRRATMIEAYESIFGFRQEEYITRQKYSATCNLAMRREVFDAVGPFAGIDFAEDRDWGLRAARLGFAIRYVPEMIVYHPARRSFKELCAKWDRHISHTFAEDARGLVGHLRWVGRSAAVAGSPFFEARRIIASPRVAGFRERCSAALVLIMIRLYRARKMMAALLGGKIVRASRQWNRVW